MNSMDTMDTMTDPIQNSPLGHAHEINGQPANAHEFIALACDPTRSVVVEACAGSGKTWLLVARMLRLLLTGAEGAQLLAITFTRKAAQEMRERLLQLLHELALAPDDIVLQRLHERGIQQPGQHLADARSLYERVLASPQALSIDTFHSWFGRLLPQAPLASGVPHGYSLCESDAQLRQEAYSIFLHQAHPGSETYAALLQLYELVGDSSTKKLLDAFLDKRAEWWAATSNRQQPLQQLADLMGDDATQDARLNLWHEHEQGIYKCIQNIARLLACGTATNQDRARAIEQALSSGPSLAAFEALWHEFFTSDDKVRSNRKTNSLKAALVKAYGIQGQEVFDTEFEEVAEFLAHLARRAKEPQVLALNAALFTAGSALLACYQTLKTEARVFDFTDLEWHVYRLLTREPHAAYLQARLDTRYKHILLDEFQDTNPLQWNIVQAWLGAYAGDAPPSVFVVGDPKQSIYRFRRADPRVFEAAKQFLHQQGAALLRTNQTRRNAPAIVECLNHSFTDNPLFAPQTTLASGFGEAFCLPLITVNSSVNSSPNSSADTEPESATATNTASGLRNPLQTPAPEVGDNLRRLEGEQLAQALWHMQHQHGLQWKDMLLLVKKRTHLSAYESALRAAAIPFISDRRGGLLQTLEVADIIALLNFLITPAADLALAHVLKSPIFSATDQDLIALALAQHTAIPAATWWQCLPSCKAASAALQGAHTLLSQWLEAAPRLPVHDLLDLILHQGELVARYVAASTPTLRSQVAGNIDAFVELALNMDAGRYPSLPKFIAALSQLRTSTGNDAPDEASADLATNAVRILTIHSAKGLEAPLVALLDANHSQPARDDLGILCDWPQDSIIPTHFSAFAQQRGAARDAMFMAEEALKQQEDWNLLYVALTRAKQVLLVSGVASGREADEEGIQATSWYARLQLPQWQAMQELSQASQAHQANSATQQASGRFEWPLFAPQAFPSPLPFRPPSPALREEQTEGRALHLLMERLTSDLNESGHWPPTIPDAAFIANWLPCPLALAQTLREQAECMLTQPALRRFFDAKQYQTAYNELELLAGSEVLRMDRVVLADDAVWILDYKRQLLAAEMPAYQKQLRQYQYWVQQVFAGRTVRALLVSVQGETSEVAG